MAFEKKKIDGCIYLYVCNCSHGTRKLSVPAGRQFAITTDMIQTGICCPHRR